MLRKNKPASSVSTTAASVGAGTNTRLNKEQLEMKIAELLGNSPPYSPKMFEQFKQLSMLQKQGRIAPGSLEYQQLKSLQQQLTRAKEYCAFMHYSSAS